MHTHTQKQRAPRLWFLQRKYTELLTYAFGLLHSLSSIGFLVEELHFDLTTYQEGKRQKEKKEKKENALPNGHNLGYFCSVVKSLLSLLINIASFPMVGLCILSHKNN